MPALVDRRETREICRRTREVRLRIGGQYDCFPWNQLEENFRHSFVYPTSMSPNKQQGMHNCLAPDVQKTHTPAVLSLRQRLRQNNRFATVNQTERFPRDYRNPRIPNQASVLVVFIVVRDQLQEFF